MNLRLLRLRLSKGKTRLDYTREFAAELAKLQATIVALAPNDGDAAKSFRADYANRLGQWFVSAQASESPFGRGVARLIAGQLGQNLARWANDGSSPNADLGAAHLSAAQAFAAGVTAFARSVNP